jgi:glycosyltransferase involved in cell wall biosynthesis
LLIFALGVARNCEKTIGPTIQSIENAVLPLTVDKWHVVESDSSDDTIRALTEIGRQNPRVTFSTLGRLSEVLPERTARISFCREQARKWVLAQDEQPDLVIVVDLDGVAKGLAKSSIFHALRRNELESAVLTANSRGRYFDIFALRVKGLIQESYVDTESRMLASGLNPFRAKFLSLIRLQTRIGANAPRIEVQSAFGGLAVYPKKAMELARYSVDSGTECEHVAFHEILCTSGFRVFIEPSIRVKGEHRHTAFSSLFLRPVWLMLGSLPNWFAIPLAGLLRLKSGQI